MTKQELKQLKDLKNEIRLLCEDIAKQKTRIVSDSVEGSSPTFPYCKHRIVITGVEMTKKHNGLTEQLEDQLELLQDKLFNLENGIEQIDDSLTRTIIRLYFRNGLTEKEIGQEVGYDQSVISRKLTDYTNKLED